MAFALPLAARSPAAPRARAWLVRLVPALLVCAGATLLTRAPSSGAPQGESIVAPDKIAPIGGIPASGAIGALLVVGGLLFFLPSLLQRFGGLAARARGARRIEIVESRPLGGRRSLLLVEVEGRRLLLGASEAGLAPLAELGPERARFASALAHELAAPCDPPAPSAEGRA
jgi:flagellar biosynthetic protein FliO